MIAATIRIVQVLDLFEVRAVITVFSPGMDPEQFDSTPVRVQLPDDVMSQDALSITKTLTGIWSEMTISK